MGVYDCCICETPIYGAKETRHANPKLAHAECIDKQNERARIEAETVAKIVALVDRLTSFEVNACTHHAESLKAIHSKDRVPLHRMHECAAKQSLALGSIIKGAILSGDWKPRTLGGG